MKTKKFRAHFKKPLLLKNVLHSFKDGLYLCEENKDSSYWGEISPLPEFSKESFEDIQVPNFSQNSTNLFTSYDSPYASVRFGLSMLENLKKLEFRSIPSNKAKIQGLLQGSLDEVICKAKELEKNNIAVAKLKVGRASFADERDMLKALIQKTNLQLRVDCNQKWKLSEAIDFFKDIQRERIDFLEEPLANPKELEYLYIKTQIPYALDESIEIFRTHKLKGLKALVLKPMLIGDYSDIRSIISDYTRRNTPELKIIISSSYETTLGIDYLKKMALQLSENEYHGLDTLNALDRVDVDI